MRIFFIFFFPCVVALMLLYFPVGIETKKEISSRLVSGLQNPNDKIRQNTLQQIQTQVFKSPLLFAELQRAIQHEKSSLKTQMLQTLCELYPKKAVPFLEELLHQETEDNKAEVVIHLCKLSKPSRSFLKIQSAFQDSDSFVRKTIVQCLACWNTEDVISFLMDVARNDCSSDVRTQATKSLRDIHYTSPQQISKVIQTLLWILENDYGDAQYEALYALGRWKSNPSIHKEISKYLKFSDTRPFAQKALEN